MTVIDDRYEADQIPSVDLSIIAEAAQMVADAVTAGEPVIEVVFAPGDATEYRLVIAKPRELVAVGSCDPRYRQVGAGELLVAMLTPEQHVYQWGPGNSVWTDSTYVAGHWGLEPWSARVLAAFLNMLREALSKIAGVEL